MRRCFVVVLLISAALWGADPVLLILEKGASVAGFYSLGGEKLAGVPVGQHPHEMVLSNDDRYVYTTDNGTMKIEQEGTGGNTVSIVDVVARKKVGEISLGQFRRPHGIDIDRHSGRIYVSTELPDQLLEIDPHARKVLRTFDTKGKTSHMVRLGPGAKFAYVSNSNSANIAAINLATSEVKLLPTGKRPEGAALSKDGRELYVANREGAGITVIDTAHQEVIGEIKTGKGPVRAILTPDGSRLVYALIYDNAVGIADPVSRKVIAQVPVGEQLVSIHVSADGKLAFSSAEYKDTVYVVSIPEQRIVRQIKTAAGTEPDAVMELKSR